MNNPNLLDVRDLTSGQVLRIVNWHERTLKVALDPMKLAQFLITNTAFNTDSEHEQEQLQRDLADAITKWVEANRPPEALSSNNGLGGQK